MKETGNHPVGTTVKMAYSKPSIKEFEIMADCQILAGSTVAPTNNETTDFEEGNDSEWDK